MDRFDAVIVGSGINSLAAGALLARAGWSVCILERNDWLGGAIKTAEITEPGFHHDVFSCWHPLWVGGAAGGLLGDDLAARGLEYLNTEYPTGSVFPDGEAAFLLRTADANAVELDRHAAGDGAAWKAALDGFLPNADLSFGLLGTELWSRAGLTLGGRAARRLGQSGLAEFSGNVLVSSRHWLQETFASERAHGLLAPWVLHTGLGPDAAASGFMTQVIAVAIQEGGMPVPKGGGARLVDALVRLIEDNGGICRTGAEVESIVVRNRIGRGRPHGGRRHVARRQGRARERDPDPALRAAAREPGRRGGRGRTAVPLRPRRDADPLRALRAATLGRRRAAREDRDRPRHSRPRRRLPRRQRGRARAAAGARRRSSAASRSPIDPSRAPEGAGMLWIQLQELPWEVKGDAAGELDPGDGTWSEELREQYADRIQQRLEAHIPNLETAVIRRTSLSPADLQAANPNLHHGDPYSGSLALDQNFLWRPFPARPGHRTPVDRLWHIGASTWPGPGLGAGSGTIVALELLKAPVVERILQRFRRQPASP